MPKEPFGQGLKFSYSAQMLHKLSLLLALALASPAELAASTRAPFCSQVRVVDILANGSLEAAQARAQAKGYQQLLDEARAVSLSSQQLVVNGAVQLSEISAHSSAKIISQELELVGSSSVLVGGELKPELHYLYRACLELDTSASNRLVAISDPDTSQHSQQLLAELASIWQQHGDANNNRRWQAWLQHLESRLRERPYLLSDHAGLLTQLALVISSQAQEQSLNTLPATSYTSPIIQDLIAQAEWRLLDSPSRASYGILAGNQYLEALADKLEQYQQACALCLLSAGAQQDLHRWRQANLWQNILALCSIIILAWGCYCWRQDQRWSLSAGWSFTCSSVICFASPLWVPAALFALAQITPLNSEFIRLLATHLI